MKVTKYEHSFLVIEEQGKQLMIDPDSFMDSLPDNLHNVVGIIVTHVHPDHLNEEYLKSIQRDNPEAPLYTTAEAAKELKEVKAKTVTGGDKAQIGPFNVRFLGGQHAIIHPSWPVFQNVGVMVNETLYDPGDSFVKPDAKVKLLCLPVSAPWLKISEAMDFYRDVKPTAAIPMHNALLSEIGQNLTDMIINQVASDIGSSYQSLKPGESIEIKV